MHHLSQCQPGGITADSAGAYQTSDQRAADLPLWTHMASTPWRHKRSNAYQSPPHKTGQPVETPHL